MLSFGTFVLFRIILNLKSLFLFLFFPLLTFLFKSNDKLNTALVSCLFKILIVGRKRKIKFHCTKVSQIGMS